MMLWMQTSSCVFMNFFQHKVSIFATLVLISSIQCCVSGIFFIPRIRIQKTDPIPDLNPGPLTKSKKTKSALILQLSGSKVFHNCIPKSFKIQSD
jgi:hypothetical protein